MPCTDCKDSRVNCSDKISSTCVPYNGKVSPLIKDLIPCDPNVNDVLEQVQTLIEKIKKGLGDNTYLDKKCLSYNPLTVTQKDLNQEFTNDICALRTAVSGLSTAIDASTFMIAIDLLCLTNVTCAIPTTYSLLDILERILVKLCDHETRITAIETFLNL